MAFVHNEIDSIIDLGVRKREVIAGCERSTIILHLPGLPRLGITPNLLIRRAGRGGRGKGPATLLRWTSRDKYPSTTWGFWRVDCMFWDMDWSLAMRDGS